MTHHLTTPITQEQLDMIHAGDKVLISGTIYTARDAAHKKLIQQIDAHQPLPFDLQGNVIYYTGPCPAKPGHPIGSCGPTTSYRMDAFTPPLLDRGLAIMIGKGNRSKDVVDAMIRNGAVYLAATGGAGALLANQVESAQIIAFEELMAEAVRKLTVNELPLICAIDNQGNSLYQSP